MIRSLLRIIVTTLIAVAVLVLTAFLAFTQPFVSGAGHGAPELAASPERLRRHVEALALGFGPRDVDHPESLQAAARYVIDEFAAVGLETDRQLYQAYGTTLENLIVSLGPATGPLVVVGAHYDTFGGGGPNPGADDNASGVAGVLELARLLRDVELPMRLELVAFTGEEPPLFAGPQMGSRVYAEDLHRRGDLPVVMVSLEMIGYFSETQPWPSPLLSAIYPSRGDFVLVAGRPRDRAWTAWLLGGFRHGGGIPARSWVGPRISGADASDHQSFWDLDVPAILVTDTAFVRNPHYHTSEDLPATLDYHSMAQVVSGLARALTTGPPR